MMNFKEARVFINFNSKIVGHVKNIFRIVKWIGKCCLIIPPRNPCFRINNKCIMTSFCCEWRNSKIKLICPFCYTRSWYSLKIIWSLSGTNVPENHIWYSLDFQQKRKSFLCSICSTKKVKRGPAALPANGIELGKDNQGDFHGKIPSKIERNW